jgi:hypothetical protein
MTDESPIREIKSWPYHLGLCSSWLEIIAKELPLKGDELGRAEAMALLTHAALVHKRAEALCIDLANRAASDE